MSIAEAPLAAPHRLLVVLPNWVGDVVLASPTLAALRAQFPGQIAYLMRPYVAEVVAGCGWHDAEIFWPPSRGFRTLTGVAEVGQRLRRERFGAAVLLTNSFKSALAVGLGGVPRRVGYAREARGWLLTQRLRPHKQGGRFVPGSVLPYYARLAEALGFAVTDLRLRLGITDEQRGAGEQLRAHYGLQHRPYAVINVGAAFGASKCWLPERFAAVCDGLHDELGIIGVLVGAPGEHPLMRTIASLARRPIVCCDNPGTSLGSLKEIVRGARLLICNDTGPRHYGNAFDVPTVTIFGPTHQAWTDTGYPGEVKLQARVECGPCQLPRCPIDHRCMREVTVEHVLSAARALLQARGAIAAGPSAMGAVLPVLQ